MSVNARRSRSAGLSRWWIEYAFDDRNGRRHEWWFNGHSCTWLFWFNGLRMH